MHTPLPLSDRVELSLFALFQLAWSGVCVVSMLGAPELLSDHAGDSGMESFFERLAGLNPWLLSLLALVYWGGGLSLIGRKWCGLWPSIAAQSVMSVSLLIYSGLARHDMTMLGVLLMSVGIQWRLLVFQRALRVEESRSSITAGSRF